MRKFKKYLVCNGSKDLVICSTNNITGTTWADKIEYEVLFVKHLYTYYKNNNTMVKISKGQNDRTYAFLLENLNKIIYQSNKLQECIDKIPYILKIGF